MKIRNKYLIAIVALLVTIVIAILFGATNIGTESIGNFNVYLTIITKIRIPRVLVALLIGIGLSLSGQLLQSMLKNPLADPFTLGISSGASVGACIAIVLQINSVPLFSFISALGTAFLVLFLARRIDKMLMTETIVLIGIVISLFISSIVSLMLVLFSDKAREIMIFLNGSLASAQYSDVLILGPIVLIGVIYARRRAMELDILSFGENEAHNLGINVKRIKIEIIIISSLLTAACVSVAGIIGFIGLIVPHFSRKIFGSKHANSLIGTMIYGGIFLISSDFIARTLIDSVELPVGAITAIFGAPFFIYVFFRKGR